MSTRDYSPQYFLNMLKNFLSILIDQRALVTAGVIAVLGLTSLFGFSQGQIDQFGGAFGEAYEGLILIVQGLAKVVGAVVMVAALVKSWTNRPPSGLYPFTGGEVVSFLEGIKLAVLKVINVLTDQRTIVTTAIAVLIGLLGVFGVDAAIIEQLRGVLPEAYAAVIAALEAAVEIIAVVAMFAQLVKGFAYRPAMGMLRSQLNPTMAAASPISSPKF